MPSIHIQKISKLLFTLLFTVFITSCATITGDIEVESHVDPDIDLNIYKSYAWVGSAKILFDPVGQWEQPTLDTDEEVKFNINRELRSKGLYEAEKEPDLLVAFAAVWIAFSLTSGMP